jgi:hypothetical protein
VIWLLAGRGNPDNPRLCGELLMPTKILLMVFLGVFSKSALAQALAPPRGPVSSEHDEVPLSPPPPFKGSAGPGMKKFGQPAPVQGFYGLLDLKHTVNDYFSEGGNRVRRDPALHAKLRIGGKFYGETLDVSAGFGGTKLPASQRVYQNRPDVMVDVYPIKGRLVNLMVYGNAMFPVRSTDLDPTEFSDGDRYDQDYRRAMDATILTVGAATNLKLETYTKFGRFFARVGADAWTRMYSKPLYIEEGDGSRELGLVDQTAPAITRRFEDRAMRYVHQQSGAIGYSPTFLPRLEAEVAGYSESRYLPKYSFRDESASWDYVYEPERVSFTRFKVAMDLTSSTTISNELYYLRNGFFAEDRINQERRFKNILRLAIKL